MGPKKTFLPGRTQRETVPEVEADLAGRGVGGETVVRPPPILNDPIVGISLVLALGIYPWISIRMIRVLPWA